MPVYESGDVWHKDNTYPAGLWGMSLKETSWYSVKRDGKDAKDWSVNVPNFKDPYSSGKPLESEVLFKHFERINLLIPLEML